MKIHNSDIIWKNSLSLIIAFFSIFVIISSCTTLDHDPPDKVETVYRIKIENTSNTEINYETELTTFYIDHKQSEEVPDGVITADEPAKVIFETKKGSYGVSIDIQIKPRHATLKIILEEGTGVGDSFEFERVAEVSESNFVAVLRYGEKFGD